MSSARLAPSRLNGVCSNHPSDAYIRLCGDDCTLKETFVPPEPINVIGVLSFQRETVRGSMSVCPLYKHMTASLCAVKLAECEDILKVDHPFDDQ
ncbi:hypothetical protein F2P81_015203 [Scophthalmus maximus]|uniref:Uncharacterized protein n=1 Tax=Scophthalmus maximus TaxID=52904 RepID=A0A6A4SFI2_SCOMX|nr:hypothetical protein F2P81_015203 [Scophthalmus maximus]